MLFGWVDIRTALIFIAIGLMVPFISDSTTQWIRKFGHPTEEEIEILKLRASLVNRIALHQYPEIGRLFEKVELLQKEGEERVKRSFRNVVIQAIGFFFLGIIAALIVSTYHWL